VVKPNFAVVYARHRMGPDCAAISAHRGRL